jgi:iron complex outermembrane receptor protein
VRGVELALQHTFGDTGFGFIANATFVDTNKPYDPRTSAQSGFAVTGLANSANFVGFFDKYGFEFRAALSTGATSICCSSARCRTPARSVRSRRSSMRAPRSISAPAMQITKEINVFWRSAEHHQRDDEHAWPVHNQLLDVYGLWPALHRRRPLPLLGSSHWGGRLCGVPGPFC